MARCLFGEQDFCEEFKERNFGVVQRGEIPTESVDVGLEGGGSLLKEVRVSWRD